MITDLDIAFHSLISAFPPFLRHFPSQTFLYCSLTWQSCTTTACILLITHGISGRVVPDNRLRTYAVIAILSLSSKVTLVRGVSRALSRCDRKWCDACSELYYKYNGAEVSVSTYVTPWLASYAFSYSDTFNSGGTSF